MRRVKTLASRTLLALHPGRRVVQATDGFRYHDPGGAVIDVFASGHVDVQLSQQEEDRLPASFYGTVTGLLLALRGGLPMHGSAVEIAGEAVLICGSSGAGKSTATAALIAAGGKLISDDLSVLSLRGGVPHLFAGRRTLRLFDEVAAYLQGRVELLGVPTIAEGKLAVLPPHVDPVCPIRLGTVLVLGSSQDRQNGMLAAQMFRPGRLQELPGHRQRLAAVAIAASQVRLLVGERVETRSREAFAEAGQRLLDEVKA